MTGSDLPRGRPASTSEQSVGRPDEDGARDLRRSSELVVGRVFALGANLATQVLLVRVLTKSDFGALSLGLSVAILAETSIALGLDRAVSRYLAIYDEIGDPVRARGLLRAVALVMLAATAALLAVGVAILAGLIPVDVSTTVALLALTGPLLAADSVLIAVLTVFGRSRVILARRFVADPLLRLAAVVTVGLTGSAVEWLGGAYLAIGALGTVWLWNGARSALRSSDLDPFGRASRGDPAWDFHPVLWFALPLFSNDLVQVVVTSLDAVSVGALGSLEDVATLRSVQPLARLNQLVLLSFGYLFVPRAARKLARGQDRAVDDWYWTATISVALLTWPVFVATFSGASGVIPVLFGDRYESSHEVLALLALGNFAHVMFGFNGMTLNVFAKVRMLVVVNLTALVIGVLLNLTLIPRWGALGAAAAVALTLLGHNVLRQGALVLTASIGPMTREQRVFFAVVVASVGTLAALKALGVGWVAECVAGAVLGVPIVASGRRCVDLRALNPLGGRALRR